MVRQMIIIYTYVTYFKKNRITLEMAFDSFFNSAVTFNSPGNN